MNTTDITMNPTDTIICPGNSQELDDNFIEDLFDDEGAFGEADCAGL